MQRKKFSWKARLKSFDYAWQGLKQLFFSEHNSWIHLALTIAALALAFILKINTYEAIALIIVIAFVWVTELLNTAIEKSMDFISLEKHPQIKKIKDLAAAAVLIAALAAVIVGCFIFIPKIYD